MLFQHNELRYPLQVIINVLAVVTDFSLFLEPGMDRKKALQDEVAAIVSIIFYLFFVCIFVSLCTSHDTEEVTDI